MPATQTTRPRQPAKPLRIPPRVAAEMCSVSYFRFTTLVNTLGLFTVVPSRPGERGVGKRYFLLTDEVEVYATQGEEALREFRARKKRLKTK